MTGEVSIETNYSAANKTIVEITAKTTPSHSSYIYLNNCMHVFSCETQMLDLRTCSTNAKK